MVSVKISCMRVSLIMHDLLGGIITESPMLKDVSPNEMFRHESRMLEDVSPNEMFRHMKWRVSTRSIFKDGRDARA